MKDERQPTTLGLENKWFKIAPYRKPFEDTFGMSLDKQFFDGIFGFHLIKFEEYLMKEKGYDENKGSMADFVEKKYGKEAKDLVESLCSI